MNGDLLRKHLIYEEGLRLHPYRDSEGYWTIGVGHLIDNRKGGYIPKSVQSFPISVEIALEILENDISDVQIDLDLRIPWLIQLSKVRETVFTSMAFQMGVWGLLGFKNALKHAKNGDFRSAAVEMTRSKWFNQTPKRANRMSNAMDTNLAHFLTGDPNE